MKRFNYRIELAYDGARFAGFQQQVAERTVESAVVDALRPLLPSLRGVAVGGRTDRGVHATGQVISFWSYKSLPLDELAERIGAADPDALWVNDVRLVSPSFHAQHSARLRRYVYLHSDDGALDVARVDRLLFALVGRRSFSAFARDTPAGASVERHLFEASARREDVGGSPFVRFDFAANGFLRRQVRVMVATAIREASAGAGAGDDALLRIAESGDRRASALPAPASGLVLTRICYDPVARR